VVRAIRDAEDPMAAAESIRRAFADTGGVAPGG
jgi:thiamine monophosphate synthase